MRLLLCSFAALALAFGTAETQAATRDWPVNGFDKVDLHAAAEVTIQTGPRFAVHAEGDPRLLDRLSVSVRGGTLTLGWQDHDASIHTHGQPLHVSITMPRLVGAGLSGAGTMAVDRVEAPNFFADVGGAGTIRIATLHAQHTTLAMGGTGEIVVAGTTDQLDARVSGVGSIDAGGLTARAGRLGMSGTGQIRAQIDGPADVTLSGLGHVDVVGHPRCTIHKSGLGGVRCG
ncbi:MAG TPA: head GIN domain-containing protein [Sphingomonas sp.]|nr:head GIN domain-containing protein [Sphingomonas sp.]